MISVAGCWRQPGLSEITKALQHCVVRPSYPCTLLTLVGCRLSEIIRILLDVYYLGTYGTGLGEWDYAGSKRKRGQPDPRLRKRIRSCE